jgi:hypothetical protein
MLICMFSADTMRKMERPSEDVLIIGEVQLKTSQLIQRGSRSTHITRVDFKGETCPKSDRKLSSILTVKSDHGSSEPMEGVAFSYCWPHDLP